MKQIKDVEMMHAHRPEEQPDNQATFSSVYDHWAQLHDRFFSLRRLSDAASRISTDNLRFHVQEKELENEIDSLERCLEETTEQIMQATDILPSHMNAILRVLLADLKYRHHLDDDDLAVRLIKRARALT